MIYERALISGGTRGIGFAIAERFVQGGMSVGLLFQKDAQAAERARLALGDKVAVLACDVADSAQCDAAVKTLSEQLGGRFDVLVNNAGMVDDALFLFSDAQRLRRLMDVHLFGAMHLVRATLKGMIAKRHGAIINVISPSAFGGRPGQTGYAAAKAALLAFSKTLAQEVGPSGVRVNALSPGLIDTELVRALPEAVRADLLSRIPMGRIGTPAEVASAAALILRADYMHGAVLAVDGGLT